MNKTTPNLELGNKIEIYIGNQGYVSQVSDIINKDKLIILGPIKYGKLVNILIGTELKIMFTLKDKARYWFNGVVENVDRENLYKLHIKKINDTVKLQEREYFRLKKILDVSITLDNNDIIKVFTEDISGKGLKIVTKRTFNLGDNLFLEFSLNDKNIKTTGEVVRVEDYDEINNNIYGICYNNLDKESRDIIVKYIFEEQRKLRKKGLN
ncbi:flagellar brake protein [Clostridium sp. D2Q-11]|uniref:Flagellar brake protein n=1 Tax=Anaeromonas frigoriresistens TaxID=2683708 RepID=A0A942V0Y5_9FIRM|nr:PilZ domain-containing protein [Anaeromonas frigoriresistens]MBS4539866.1 flagellar brake protein [Anaeromonas frigoriresistens]